MDPKMALDRIEELTELLYNTARVLYRLQIYAAIEVILKELEEMDEANGYAKEKIVTLRWHLRVLCKLSDDNGRGEYQHYLWALAEIEKLQSPLCFGTKGK